MDNENVKILRSKVSITLSKAIQLLKKNNEDVTLSEQDYHNENVIEICKAAKCEEEIARKEYHICNCDVKKAIERINQKPVVIETGNNSDSKIGFILWPENVKGEFYKTAKRNDVFISTEDFDIVLKDFESVFPLLNTFNNVEQESFDITGHNFLDNKTCKNIIEKIELIETDDVKVKVFLEELIKWLDDKLIYADYIVIYGNL